MLFRFRLAALVIAFLGAATVTLSAQDFRELRKEFKKAVVEQNSMSVSSLAGDIAGFNDRPAIDLLIWGYDYYAQLIDKAWRERQKVQARVDAYRDVHEGQDKLMKELEARGGQVQTGSKLHKEYLKWKEGSDEYYGLKEQVAGIDRTINEVNQIKAGIVSALAGMSSDDAIGELANDLKRSAAWTTRAAVAEALGQVSDMQALDALREHLVRGDNQAGVIVAVLDALGKRNTWDEATVQAALPHLNSTFWQVRFATARALAASKSPLAIEPMIQALGRADGRLQHDLHEALVGLTGVDKGFKPESWQGWFEANRDQLLGNTYKPREGEAAGRPGADAKTQIQFYGIPVKSKNILFVIDRSDSMKEPGAFNEEELQYIGTGGTKKASSRLKGLKPAGTRKIDIAKYQLKKVLLMVPNGTRFNVIFYNHQFQPMSSKMITLNDGEREEAFSFIDPLEPHGNTDIWQALSEAMKFCAELGPDGKLTRQGADTIYLLTDGLPFPPGKVVGPGDIRSRFKDWNRVRHIVVHTIFVAAEEAKDFTNGNDFMKELAGENGGMFKGPKDTIWKKDVEDKDKGK